MNSVHFRLPQDIIQIIDAATQLGIFKSRSKGLYEATTYAILGDTSGIIAHEQLFLSVQTVYDSLAAFSKLVQEFNDNASYLIQESLVDNLDPLLDYLTHEREVLELFPLFWQGHLLDILQAIPEHRVIESCLEMGDNSDQSSSD